MESSAMKHLPPKVLDFIQGTLNLVRSLIPPNVWWAVPVLAVAGAVVELLKQMP